MSVLAILLCMVALTTAHRRFFSMKRSSSDDGHGASSSLTDPCDAALWKGRPMRKPRLGKAAIRSLLDADQIRWLDCKKEHKEFAATMSREIDARERPWGDTFAAGAAERNRALQEDKDFKRRMAADMRRELVGVGVEKVKEKFQGMASRAADARTAVQQAVWMLMSIPSLTKAEFEEAANAVSKKWAKARDEWPISKEMLLNLVANGHLGGPGDGRARVSPERKAYLATLKTLDPIDPGPRFQVRFPDRNTSKSSTPPCAPYARVCGPDAGGLQCCTGSGQCTPKQRIKTRDGAPLVLQINVCL